MGEEVFCVSLGRHHEEKRKVRKGEIKKVSNIWGIKSREMKKGSAHKIMEHSYRKKKNLNTDIQV